jgi:hypothetical protein
MYRSSDTSFSVGPLFQDRRKNRSWRYGQSGSEALNQIRARVERAGFNPSNVRLRRTIASLICKRALR